MKEVPIWRKEQIVEVPVSHAQQVRDYAVASAASHECVKHTWCYPIRARTCCIGMMFTKIVEQATLIFARDCSKRLARHKLHHAIDCTGGQHSVRRDLQVEILLAQQAVHEREKLNDELILPEIIAVLEDDSEAVLVGASELQLEGKQVGFEDG